MGSTGGAPVHPATPSSIVPPALPDDPIDPSAHRQRLEMLGILAGGIAHDFNNLLTGINGHLEAAEALLPDAHPARAELSEVHRAVSRATDLTRRVLTLGRSESGRSHCDVVAQVEEAMPLLRSSLPRMIELRARMTVPTGYAAIGPGPLQQVLFNLGLNAAQAIGPGAGIIDVGVTRVAQADLPEMDVGSAGHGAYLCLSVSDTGSGMDPAMRAQIFDPFFTTRPRAHGTGLGLAIVRSIVLQHHGAISVQSIPGEGTVFRVFLPEAAPALSSRVTATAARMRSSPVHIAIVDDEETVVRLATQALEFSGYRATAIASADECLVRVLREPGDFDLIITDQRLPTMSGTDLIRRLREQGVKTPVLVTSGSPGSTTLAEINDVASARFLSKPFTLIDLLGAVQELLSER